jgi:hypothetical protein
MAPKARKSQKALLNVSAFGSTGGGIQGVSILQNMASNAVNPLDLIPASGSGAVQPAPEMNESVILKLSFEDDKDASKSVSAHNDFGEGVLSDGGVGPYTDSTCAHLHSVSESVVPSNGDASKPPLQANNTTTNNNNSVVTLLRDFENKCNNKEWPSSTNVHCYWCCHPFDNAPFGIPIKYVKERFNVFGCFCSLECAAAYNRYTHESLDVIWERHSLINFLASKLGFDEAVRAAPDKIVMEKYGGHMSIETFRGFCKTNKLVNLNFPPMTMLPIQVEEIHQCNVNANKFVPLDTDRVKKIMLRRTKPPQLDQKNTLDKTMNIRMTTMSEA